MIKQRGWRRWPIIVGLVLALVQFWNGFGLAIAYPALNLRSHNAVLVQTLAGAHQETSASTRFAIDPSLDHFDLRPYLSRPSLAGTSFGDEGSRIAWAQWRRFCVGQVDNPPLEYLDAVVLRIDRFSANRYFKQQEWRSTPLNEYYILWLRTD